MIHALYLISVHPRRFVIHIVTVRAAQITARLLAERFPGMAFTYGNGPDFQNCDCPPSIRDSALSAEVGRAPRRGVAEAVIGFLGRVGLRKPT